MRQDPAAVCGAFAAVAGTVDTVTSTLGQSRRAAARTYGTPELQALYDGAGQGHDREQELWRQHQARVTAHAEPAGHDGDEQDLSDPRSQQHVTVTGSAVGADGWTAPIPPYRLSCRLVTDPVGGWTVADVAVQPLSTVSPNPT